jgi:alkanesulfonate monooxygenase SsuD/methylene tetrahydromethanopterin reductase-like flavin-dependent oxidoreductase (luciferase family)
MLGAKLILRSDPDEAQRVAEELVEIHGWGPSVWDFLWATTPDRAADRLVEFVEAGAHSFSPQIGWPYDRETIERLIGEVVPAVNARITA